MTIPGHLAPLPQLNIAFIFFIFFLSTFLKCRQVHEFDKIL